ncbi:hypothetical protein BpV1_083 [Bathycoccus sp. RCC1105 virus BpV1]|uniref:hypothetical protein n=1 Tax=Bathycoccus sp. RCC1105 virus BpV1 TaxID=880159 RepID=UPI0001EF43D4|nr:hypothetical protein BpV1_083 [Bathycoccus sp. RCC1105 virus BpV1]ADQ91710.1 hypothetical protein BpV1_083 [Bathycoccus sp. RCC1105 virus BpV1]|tara:strand:- start:2968 stop:3186 length:219 start_codon:yes stop_codon:yes gene_type:complete
MNTSEPEGYEATSKHFKIYDDDDSSDTESDSDTETDSGSDSGIERINVGMLKGYMKPKHYKKILIEEDLLPD